MDETITEKDLDDLFWIFSTGTKAVCAGVYFIAISYCCIVVVLLPCLIKLHMSC